MCSICGQTVQTCTLSEHWTWSNVPDSNRHRRFGRPECLPLNTNAACCSSRQSEYRLLALNGRFCKPLCIPTGSASELSGIVILREAFCTRSHQPGATRHLVQMLTTPTPDGVGFLGPKPRSEDLSNPRHSKAVEDSPKAIPGFCQEHSS